MAASLTTSASVATAHPRPQALALPRSPGGGFRALAAMAGLDTDTAADSIDQEFQNLFGLGDDAEEAQQQSGRGRAGRDRGGKGRGRGRQDPARDDGVKKSQLKAKRQPAFKKCKGCHLKIKAEECANNFPGCWGCKRALDNISKAASRQGPDAVKFVSEARNDEDKCFAMVQSYLEACPEACESLQGRKRGPWSVGTYMERFKAASGVVRDKVGEMMWEKLYIEWAMTTRGGRKSEEDAVAQWKEWERAVLNKDPKIFSDNGGPAGKLRIWVHTADTMVFRSEYMHEKIMSCEVAPIKKPQAEDLVAIRSELLRDHNSCAGAAGSSADFSAIAQGMMKSGSDVFKSNDGFIGSVFDLVKDAEVEEEEDESHDTGGDDGPRGSPTKRMKVEAAALWVDRDRVVSSTTRAAKNAAQIFYVKVHNQLKLHRTFQDMISKDASDEFKKAFAGEMSSLSVRIATLALVAENDDEDKLKQHLATFSQKVPQETLLDGSAEEQLLQSQVVAIGSAPPCEQYLNLRPMKVMDNIIADFQKCQTPETLKEVTSRIAVVKGAINNLLMRAAGAEKALTHAEAQLQRDAAKLAAEMQKPQIRVPVSADVLHDQGMSLAKLVAVHSIETAATVADFAVPFVVNAQPWVEEVQSEASQLKPQINDFLASFSPACDANQQFRASRPVPAGEGGQAFRQKLSGIFARGVAAASLVTSVGDEDIDSKLLTTSVFGISEQYKRASMELCGLACFRFGLQGTRSIVMTNSLQLIGFVVRKGVAGRITTSRQAQFFRAMNFSTLQEFAKQCSLWSVTVGPGDLLYVPYGTVVSEVLTARTVGIRVGVVVRSPADGAAHNLISTHIEGLKATQQAKLPEQVARAIGDELQTCEKLERFMRPLAAAAQPQGSVAAGSPT